MVRDKKSVFFGTGRRKCAVARVKICEGTGKFLINGKEISDFCHLDSVEHSSGGGLIGQVGAVSLGLARSLEKMDHDLRGVLKHAGLLTRDSRVRERKKSGRRGARKRFQFSKR